MRLIYPPGATPLDPNEIEGLLPNIGLQSELNAREEDNILRARRWALSPRNRALKSGITSPENLCLLYAGRVRGSFPPSARSDTSLLKRKRTSRATCDRHLSDIMWGTRIFMGRTNLSRSTRSTQSLHRITSSGRQGRPYPLDDLCSELKTPGAPP